ncbi:MAG: hypothetical protein ACI9S8_002626 [Chlamydiales bacterium]|jgi:hypothetical protein
MGKILVFTLLLITGVVCSQLLPGFGQEIYYPLKHIINFLTTLCLGFVMIHVGLEFFIDKAKWRSYTWDYVVAATTALFPWIFCAVYFALILPHPDDVAPLQRWQDSLLAGRFAAPTSAGVLFSMFLAIGIGKTWLFRKTRILAIFDDLDTILLLIPLKMAIVGFKWELVVVLIIVFSLLWLVFTRLRSVKLPYSWQWTLMYSFVITSLSEFLYFLTSLDEDMLPIHLEILLPAFVVGAIIAHPRDPHTGKDLLHLSLEKRVEKKVATVISCIFMVLVGLSTPAFLGMHLGEGDGALPTFQQILNALSQPPFVGMTWATLSIHICIVTFLANLGKMFPVFCYRSEASLRERFALSLGMCVRGEVAAAVIVTSLTLGIKGPMILVAVLSLALNLCFTGIFMATIKTLLNHASIRK